jgi:pilus biogenesis lipoprotein CpaD
MRTDDAAEGPRRHGSARALAAAALALLSACTATVPPGPAAPVAAVPVATLPPAPSLPIIDPPVEPGGAVAVVPGAEPRPVVPFAQPARVSPPGTPLVLPPPIPHGERQETLVEAVPSRIVLGSGEREQRRFVDFLRVAGRGRFDAVHLQLRGRSHGTVLAFAAAARRAGVDPLKIRAVDAPAAGGAVEAVATRYVATAPVCPSLAVVGPSVNDNDFEPTLGCSNRANLAAMVNDPADLLRNGATVPSNGARAVAGIERYQAPFADERAALRRDGGYGQAPADLGLGPSGGPVLGAGGPVPR